MKRFFTKKSKENKFNRNVAQASSNSDKLQLILSELKHMKSSISDIRTDLSDFRDEFNKYKKQDANFQEARINTFIISLLQRNKNSYNTILLPIENIYEPYNINALTELDGLILHSPHQYKMPDVSSELIERVGSIFQTGLKNNISQIKTSFMKPQLIIVESKRSISKSKIDTKIEQMFKFMNILKDMNTIDISKTLEPYNKCMNDLMQYSGLSMNELQQIGIKLIFGSDDISHNLQEYIISIYNGITSEEYYNICDKMFHEDKYATDFIKGIVNSEITSKPVKTLLNNYKSFEELRKIIHIHFVENNYDLGYISQYFTPFTDLEQFFEKMKGSIGIVQFNKATLPSLFQYNTMNET